MECKEEGCGGEINMETIVTLQTGCGRCRGSHASAYPCKICGRLHWDSGNAVFNRGGAKAYLENGEIVHK